MNSTSEPAPVAVVMISLNEEHNMRAVLDNLDGWAREIYLVDSYSSDRTVDIALQRGVYVVQRKFNGFGDQWNFALEQLPISAPWTMKLDPDERLTEELKREITRAIDDDKADGIEITRRLWFIGKRLPVGQKLIRLWRTGKCRFSDVLVNEHPLVEGDIVTIDGELEHYDSPDLHHWYDKQNRYSTAEAISFCRNAALSVSPKLFGAPLERRMWLKHQLISSPLLPMIVFAYSYLLQGAWRAGRIGFIWAAMRASVHRMIALKIREIRWTGREPTLNEQPLGQPHPSAVQATDR